MGRCAACGYDAADSKGGLCLWCWETLTAGQVAGMQVDGEKLDIVERVRRVYLAMLVYRAYQARQLAARALC